MPFGADCGPTAQPPLPADPGWEVQPKASTPAHMLRTVRRAQAGHLASLELALKPKTRYCLRGVAGLNVPPGIVALH